MPGRAPGDVSDPPGELAIVDGRRFRFKPGELVKLLDRAGHYKAATRVVMAVLIFVRNDMAVFVGKHGPVGEGERVPIEIKARARAGIG